MRCGSRITARMPSSRPASIGPTHPPGLAGLVRQDPDGAVEVLEQLGYAVRPPVEAEDPAGGGPDDADGPARPAGSSVHPAR